MRQFWRMVCVFRGPENRHRLPLDLRRQYMMPAHFGPAPLDRATGYYHDVTSIFVPYRTDRARLAALVPSPFKLAGEPTLIVAYARNRQVDWLAGRGYNLIEVITPVVFEGEQDRLRGHYTLVIWENLADPILTGREVQGMPKLFAEIPDHNSQHDEWRTSASHFGHQIVELSVCDKQPLTPQAIEAYTQSQVGNNHWMGWRFIPEVGGYGEILSEPTVFPIEQTIRSAWSGKGQVQWRKLSWEQNPTQYHIVNALADLPILEYLPALITEGSTNLHLAGNLPRALR